MKSCRYFSLLVISLALIVPGCSAARHRPVAVAPPPSPPPPPPPPPPPTASRPGSRPPAAGDHEPSQRPTGRSLLVENEPEAPGFGLYSYLLFGSRPSEATRALYVSVIKASLDKIEPVDRKIEAGYKPGQLNLYSVLLYAQPPADISTEALPNWVLDNYNFSRAERILGAVPANERGTGIYILSVLSRPLDVTRTLDAPHLWQDLSHADPAIAAAWIQYFLDQAAKDKPWEENMGEKLALDLRNYIEQAANQMQLTIPALITAIKWFKPMS